MNCDNAHEDVVAIRYKRNDNVMSDENALLGALAYNKVLKPGVELQLQFH